MEALAVWYGWARTALGAVLLVAPAPAAQLWIGDLERDRDVAGPLRALAMRDLALGLAVIAAPARSVLRRDLLALCALVDVGDATFSALDYRRTRRAGAAVTAVAAFSAAVAAGVARAAVPSTGRAATR